MTDHYISYDHVVDMDANAKLIDVIKEIGEDDELIITLERNHADNSDYIFDILKNNGFEVLPKGGHDDNKYHVIAHKKRNRDS